MSYTAAKFDALCEDAARHFLQNVVVIDNEATFPSEDEARADQLVAKRAPERVRPRENFSATVAPSGNNSASGVDTPSNKLGIQAPNSVDDVSHELDAKKLTDRFAELSIMCSVYKPGARENPVEKSANLASRADIAVVDWHLGDNGANALAILHRIVECDLKRNGRLRLLVVYTVESELRQLVKDTCDSLKSSALADIRIGTGREGGFCLVAKDLRILFLNKGRVPNPQSKSLVVEFEELPNRLIREFATFTRGLFPLVALRSVASLRDSSHQLLKMFNSDLDGTLVSHRCLLPDPPDAEEFVMDLISEKIRSILSVHSVGSNFAGVEAIKYWLAKKIGKEKSLPNWSGVTYTKAEVHDLIDKGQSVHNSIILRARKRWARKSYKDGKRFKDKDNKKIGLKTYLRRLEVGDLGHGQNFGDKDIGEKNLPRIFHDSDGDTRLRNFKFSRLSALKREAYGFDYFPAEWMPKLSLGTIVYLDNEDGVFLLCAQAKCDSVRLSEARTFPFLVLSEIGSGNRFNLVVKDKNEKHIKLFVSDKPYNFVTRDFNPSGKSGFVKAESLNEYRYFLDVDGRKYEWIADMRDFVAQRTVQQLASRVGSVGLDEYEWLRRRTTAR